MKKRGEADHHRHKDRCSFTSPPIEAPCKAGPLGLARSGSVAANFSGDIFLAFSTAHKGKPGFAHKEIEENIKALPNESLNLIFEATVQATDEAIINALVSATTMVGRNGTRVEALPHEEVKTIMDKYRDFLSTDRKS